MSYTLVNVVGIGNCRLCISFCLRVFIYLYSHGVTAVTVYGVHLTDIIHSVLTEYTTVVRISSTRVEMGLVY